MVREARHVALLHAVVARALRILHA